MDVVLIEIGNTVDSAQIGIHVVAGIVHHSLTQLLALIWIDGFRAELIMFYIDTSCGIFRLIYVEPLI